MPNIGASIRTSALSFRDQVRRHHIHLRTGSYSGQKPPDAVAASLTRLRYPAEVIQHAVWLYYCFSFSLRDVELIPAARSIVVGYESIREWGLGFGQLFANELKLRWRRPGDKWHLKSCSSAFAASCIYLWRAIDQHGHLLDILVQSRRNAGAAKRPFRKLLRDLQYVPRVIVTDKLRS